jgi:EAL and modified HD-GYP domain-containing signal transduction protein
MDDNVFIGRQPILDTNQEIMAYELLFRSGDVNTADVTDPVFATSNVLVNTLNTIGLKKILGEKLGFVNINEDIIRKDILKTLQKDIFVFEILEDTRLEPDLVNTIHSMSTEGYIFALDDFVFNEDIIRYFESIFPEISYVKVDIKLNTKESIESNLKIFNPFQILYVAEKVETIEEFNYYKNLGFHLFQGYFFSRPVIMQGKKIDPNHLAVMEIMNLIYQDADFQQIEQVFKKFPELTINLLQFINSAAIAVRSHIDSIRQALALIGQRQLLNWLILMIYAAPKSKQTGNPLIYTAIERAKSMELIVKTLKKDCPQPELDEAFLVGLLSLLDVLFQAPMEDILKDLKISPMISEAILYHRNPYGKILLLVQKSEENNFEDIQIILDELKLSLKDYNETFLEALCWSQSSGKQCCLGSKVCQELKEKNKAL